MIVTEELSLKEVCEQTGLSANSVRNYMKQFNLPSSRTEGGHRRFSPENVELLVGIKEKIRNDGWSYKQVQAWLNGEKPAGEAETEEAAQMEEAIQTEAKEEEVMDMKIEEHRDNMIFLQKCEEIDEKMKRMSDQLDDVRQLLQAQQQVAAAALPLRMQQTTDFITAERVKARLREEALTAWADKPDLKRTMRTGLFRRQEDIAKREAFIAAYVREKLAEELHREFGM